MPIFYLEKNSSGRLQVDVEVLEGWEGFERLAEVLCSKFGARVLSKVDGPDARSWMIEVDGHELLLQHDDMYGHFFYARFKDGDSVVRDLGEKLSQFEKDQRLGVSQ